MLPVGGLKSFRHLCWTSIGGEPRRWTYNYRHLLQVYRLTEDSTSQVDEGWPYMQTKFFSKLRRTEPLWRTGRHHGGSSGGGARSWRWRQRWWLKVKAGPHYRKCRCSDLLDLCPQRPCGSWSSLFLRPISNHDSTSRHSSAPNGHRWFLEKLSSAGLLWLQHGVMSSAYKCGDQRTLVKPPADGRWFLRKVTKVTFFIRFKNKVTRDVNPVLNLHGSYLC